MSQTQLELGKTQHEQGEMLAEQGKVLSQVDSKFSQVHSDVSTLSSVTTTKSLLQRNHLRRCARCQGLFKESVMCINGSLKFFHIFLALPLPPFRPAFSSPDLFYLLTEARGRTVLQKVYLVPHELSRDFSVGREVSRLLAVDAKPCWNVHQLHARAVLVDGLPAGAPSTNK